VRSEKRIIDFFKGLERRLVASKEPDGSKRGTAKRGVSYGYRKRVAQPERKNMNSVETLVAAIEVLAAELKAATQLEARLDALEKSVNGVRDEFGNELMLGSRQRSLLSRVLRLEGEYAEQKSENNSELVCASERIDSLGQMVANARDSIEEMKAEIEELKNSDNDQRIDRLEDRVDDLENGAVDSDEFENIVRKVDDLPDFGEFRDQLAMLDNLDPEIGGRVTALETIVQVAAGEFGKIKQCFASITEVTEAL